MPFTVEQLIENREPVSVYDIDPVKKAQITMVENQFSQLPVIDKYKKVLGLITSDSILRALNTFGVSIDKLRVLDAMDEIKHTFREDDNIFDLLDDLIDASAVLIVDSERMLKGIVTSYDTTQYFRRRAEDMMYAEDIETMLKDYINVYFTDHTGNIDEKAREEAITSIMPSNQELLTPFKKALVLYLQLQGDSLPKLKKDWVEQAFSEHIYRKEHSKPFEQLTQSQFIDLFLHESCWSHYSTIFSLDRQKIRVLLDDARKTRNDAAHFRNEEITSEQRERLKFCRDWLARYQSTISDAFHLNSEEVVSPENILESSDEQTIFQSFPSTVESNIEEVLITSDTSFIESKDLKVALMSEVLDPSDSRYAPLAIWLQSQPLGKERITLTFSDIEEIIGDKLPASARKHRAWWSNRLEFNPQAQQWWDAGWRVFTVRMPQEIVIFTRIEERKDAYINFFNALLIELSNIDSSFLNIREPKGENYFTIDRLPKNGTKFASLGFSFARRKHFRIELYIDTGKESENKNILNNLWLHKDAIEAELGTPLSWERLEGARASRVAIYHDGTITDTIEELANLRLWAINMMNRFQKVMEEYVNEAIRLSK